MGNELVKSYVIDGKKFNVYGCWNKETPENKFDFYDIYDENGICINEGSMFFELPTIKIITDFLNQ